MEEPHFRNPIFKNVNQQFKEKKTDKKIFINREYFVLYMFICLFVFMSVYQGNNNFKMYM